MFWKTARARNNKERMSNIPGSVECKPMNGYIGDCSDITVRNWNILAYDYRATICYSYELLREMVLIFCVTRRILESMVVVTNRPMKSMNWSTFYFDSATSRSNGWTGNLRRHKDKTCRCSGPWSSLLETIGAKQLRVKSPFGLFASVVRRYCKLSQHANAWSMLKKACRCWHWCFNP
jgi:hypothetical protein